MESIHSDPTSKLPPPAASRPAPTTDNQTSFSVVLSDVSRQQQEKKATPLLSSKVGVQLVGDELQLELGDAHPVPVQKDPSLVLDDPDGAVDTDTAQIEFEQQRPDRAAIPLQLPRASDEKATSRRIGAAARHGTVEVRVSFGPQQDPAEPSLPDVDFLVRDGEEFDRLVHDTGGAPPRRQSDRPAAVAAQRRLDTAIAAEDETVDDVEGPQPKQKSAGDTIRRDGQGNPIRLQSPVSLDEPSPASDPQEKAGEGVQLLTLAADTARQPTNPEELDRTSETGAAPSDLQPIRKNANPQAPRSPSQPSPRSRPAEGERVPPVAGQADEDGEINQQNAFERPSQPAAANGTRADVKPTTNATSNPTDDPAATGRPHGKVKTPAHAGAGKPEGRSDDSSSGNRPATEPSVQELKTNGAASPLAGSTPAPLDAPDINFEPKLERHAVQDHSPSDQAPTTGEVRPQSAGRGAQQLAYPNPAPRTDGHTPSVDPSRMTHRIVRALESAQERGGPIRLRLSPPELGSLRVELDVRDGQMVARLQAETTMARDHLIEHLPLLRERLADQGIRVVDFSVDLMSSENEHQADQRPTDRDRARDNQMHRSHTEHNVTQSPTSTSSPARQTHNGQLNVII